MSAIRGDEAHAEAGVDGKNKPNKPSENLQTMGLLKASVFPSLSSLKDKTKSNPVDTSADVSILSDNALLSATGPNSLSSVSGGIGSGDVAFEDISVYVVRSGDTVSQIATMFGVSEDTILSVNDMKKGDKPKEGDVLLVLPYSGVEHSVLKGQTIQGIATTYKVPLNEILLANDIEADTKLIVGEKLMIPGGNILNEPKPKIAAKESAAKGSAAKGGKKFSSTSSAGYFQNPVPNARRSRGVTSTHGGVDLAAPIGTPIYAAAGGKVLTAKMGWNGAYGNMVILEHSNGTRTLYAHMSKLGTSTGSQISKGELIGYVGSTGRSSGPHLHFEVLGAKNPF